MTQYRRKQTDPSTHIFLVEGAHHPSGLSWIFCCLSLACVSLATLHGIPWSWAAASPVQYWPWQVGSKRAGQISCVSREIRCVLGAGRCSITSSALCSCIPQAVESVTSFMCIDSGNTSAAANPQVLSKDTLQCDGAQLLGSYFNTAIICFLMA